jgi:MFS family permease
MKGSVYLSARSGWYAVIVLFIAYLLSIVDRQILSLFLVPIQETLQVSDTQMGILHGFTFAIFYALMGLPIARMIDAGNRRLIIAVGITLWSLATMSCGLATEYWHLLIARIFVGIGEATLLPGAVSLIADYFVIKERGKPMGVFAAGGATGNGLSMLSGAVVIGLIGTAVISLPVIGELETWQVVFMVVGFPGIVMGILIMSMKEPGRHHNAGEKGVPISEVVAYVKAHRRTYTSLLLGSSVYFIGYLAHLAWTPALLMRRFDMSPQEAGMLFGLVLITCGPLGSAFGGWYSDRMIRNGDVNGKLRVNILAAVGLLIFGSLYPLLDNINLLVIVLVPCVFLSSSLLGTAPGAIQEVTPGPMRGQLTALYTGLLNLIGFGLGPLLVALLTDNLFNNQMMVHYSIAIVIAFGGIGSILIYIYGLESYKISVSRDLS